MGFKRSHTRGKHATWTHRTGGPYLYNSLKHLALEHGCLEYMFGVYVWSICHKTIQEPAVIAAAPATTARYYCPILLPVTWTLAWL